MLRYIAITCGSFCWEYFGGRNNRFRSVCIIFIFPLSSFLTFNQFRYLCLSRSKLATSLKLNKLLQIINVYLALEMRVYFWFAPNWVRPPPRLRTFDRLEVKDAICPHPPPKKQQQTKKKTYSPELFLKTVFPSKCAILNNLVSYKNKTANGAL